MLLAHSLEPAPRLVELLEGEVQLLPDGSQIASEPIFAVGKLAN